MTLQVKIDRGVTTSQYEIDWQDDMTVLNVLENIYRYHDPSIAFRFSCRTGLCTTCMMMINGKPDLSCQKKAEPSDDGFLTLSPLPKGRTIRDLIKAY
ncbi:2Fe-2S iron-sulfur cluster-binding protein [Aquisalibacillus elongatus]|uniref:2Fe-2S iron-sulfur cluster protein n=1 Tax=Aquisalibacillus elongatus TaxID=485577 RepID=A0A3N5C6L8_9BACI|nr:2Fe-2S iron-sulfur cluster-binding protein [Aquisalibacillus elongatus]RPF53945.1 2Fe-2S iron-sulfur cluster protein [Aquisalibacillus elongatus]